MLDRIKKIYDWTPKSKVLLDIGCDRGDITIHYDKKAKKVIGLDNNKEAIAHAKKLKSNVEFVCAVGEKVPFKDNTFDTVVMGEVIEHVENEKQTITEVARVLKSGGKLILSTPHKGAFRFLDAFNMKFYFPKVYKIWKGNRFNPDIYQIQPWHRHYSLKELKTLLGPQFKIIKVHRGGLVIYPLSGLVCNALNDLFGPKGAWMQNAVARIGHVEYNIPFGKLGSAIIIIAEKK